MRRNSKETKLQLPNRSFSYMASLKFHPRHIFDTRKRKKSNDKKEQSRKKTMHDTFTYGFQHTWVVIFILLCKK